MRNIIAVIGITALLGTSTISNNDIESQWRKMPKEQKAKMLKVTHATRKIIIE